MKAKVFFSSKRPNKVQYNAAVLLGRAKAHQCAQY